MSPPPGNYYDEFFRSLVRTVREENAALSSFLQQARLETISSDSVELVVSDGVCRDVLSSTENLALLRRAASRVLYRDVTVEIVKGFEEAPSMIGEMREHYGEEFVDEFLRRVLDHADLLKDDLSLFFDLLIRKDGVNQHIGNQIQRKGKVMLQDPGIEACELFSRKCIQVSPHGLDFTGDVQGTPIPGALEAHVFDKMNDAVPFFGLVS